MPVAYDIDLTIVSLLAAGAIRAVGLAVAVLTPRRWGAPIGGAIIGGGVAVMHYLGMGALELPGHVHWDLPLVIASIVLGMILGMASLAVAVRWHSLRAVWASALLLALAILSHHFTAMGAVEVVPDPARTITELSLSPGLLGIAVAGVTVAILGVSLTAALADRQIDDKGRLLGIALDNMDQGVVMFDAAARLVICNDRYRSMYDLPSRFAKPGTAFADIRPSPRSKRLAASGSGALLRGSDRSHGCWQGGQHDLGDATRSRHLDRQPSYPRQQLLGRHPR
jgi:PAS domain-containing protein